jgi:hypothetical protein
LQLGKGDTVTFNIVETDTTCFTYNALTKPDVRTAAESTTMTLVDIHDGRVTSYQLVIAKQPNAGSTCENYPLIDRTFPVDIQGWSIAITGAAALFEVVEPVYYLQPGTSTDSAGAAVNGFFVRRNQDAEDDQTFGFSVLAHLHNWGKAGKRDIHFVPVSFGFGVSDNSEAEFLLGTGFRFGDALYLTFGKAWRKTTRLKNDMSLGTFVTDANALSGLPTRAEAGAFVSIGYRFGDIDISKFNAPFAKQPVMPQ